MAKDGLPIRRTPVQSRWDSRRFRDRYLEGADLTAHRSFAAGCGALSSVSHLCPRISKSKGDNDANTQSVLVPAGSAQWAIRRLQRSVSRRWVGLDRERGPVRGDACLEPARR